MENIHELRYQYDANLVVLITGSGGAGIGWQPASTSLAFSIARYDVAASNYTFSHEVGHMILQIPLIQYIAMGTVMYILHLIGIL